MSARPGGAPLCFYVDSSRPGHEPHQVNLGAHHGNGSCNCEHFLYRLAEPAEHTPPRDRERDPDSLRCRHILEARRFLLDDLIKRLSQPQPQIQ